MRIVGIGFAGFLFCCFALLSGNTFAEEKTKAEMMDNASAPKVVKPTSATGAAIFPYKDSAGTVVVLANEDTHPFLFYGEKVRDNLKRINVQKRYKKSFEKFFSVQDCLKKSERGKEKPDLTQIDWSIIDNKEDASVCLFRIASSYDTPESMKAWFEKGDFNEVKLTRPNKGDIHVDAGWNVRERGMRFWSNPLSRAWGNLIVWGSSFTLQYNESEVLQSAGVGHTIE